MSRSRVPLAGCSLVRGRLDLEERIERIHFRHADHGCSDPFRLPERDQIRVLRKAGLNGCLHRESPHNGFVSHRRRASFASSETCSNFRRIDSGSFYRSISDVVRRSLFAQRGAI